MRTLIAIIILTGLILILSIVPGHTHGVNWGISVNLGVPGYAPAYPVYPTAVYYPPPPVYPVYGPPVVVAPGPYYHRGYYRPYYPSYPRRYCR